MKTFAPSSGVATCLADIVNDNKWRSTWLVINPDKHSWYITEYYYRKLNEEATAFEEKKDKLYWLKNDLYYLNTRKSSHILWPG